MNVELSDENSSKSTFVVPFLNTPSFASSPPTQEIVARPAPVVPPKRYTKPAGGVDTIMWLKQE